MSDIAEMIFATQARVLVRATDTQLLTLAKGRALDPSIFDTFPPFFWANEISSDRLDSYFTKMDAETTLPNYAHEAAAGVAFLIGHNTRELPTGATLTGTLEVTDEVTRVLADAYCLQEPATQPFVSRVRAGIQKDDSVGFYGGQWICSICGRDMLTDWWECWHIPGMTYEVKDASGESTTVREVLCWALVKSAHLAEVSGVYDGSTPGAAVLQARRAAEAGRITPQQARLIEQRYRVRLPSKQIQGKGVSMGAETNGKESAPPELRAIQQILERAGAPAELLIPQGVQWLADEVARLTPLAKDGEQYRADLVESAVGEAVRALGAAIGEQQRAMLERSPLDLIKQMTAAWRTLGDGKLPGGRLTTDEAPPDTFAWKKPELSGLSQA